jgi:hypothetical protein
MQKRHVRDLQACSSLKLAREGTMPHFGFISTVNPPGIAETSCKREAKPHGLSAQPTSGKQLKYAGEIRTSM